MRMKFRRETDCKNLRQYIHTSQAGNEWIIVSIAFCVAINSIHAVSVWFSQLIINSQLTLLDQQILFLSCFWPRWHSTPALTERCLIVALQCEVLQATHNKSWQWWQETMINRPVCILSCFLLFLLVLDFLSFPDSWITVVVQSPIFFYRLLLFFFNLQMCLMFFCSQTFIQCVFCSFIHKHLSSCIQWSCHVLKNTVFMAVLQQLWFLYSPCFSNSWASWGEDAMMSYHLWQNILVSYYLFFVQLWLSVLSPTAKK